VEARPQLDVTARQRTLLQRWMQVEDRLCAVIGRVEHKLMRYPPGTRIVPSRFDRQMVRLMVAVCSIVSLALLIPRGPLRRTVMLAVLGGVVVAIFAALVLEARSHSRR
jgi:hypothetical protein